MSSEKKFKIDRKNLPTRLPIYNTLIIVIALDYWSAPDWLWGVLGTLVLIAWVSVLISFFKDDYVDIFHEHSVNGVEVPKTKSPFIERLSNAFKEAKQQKR